MKKMATVLFTLILCGLNICLFAQAPDYTIYTEADSYIRGGDNGPYGDLSYTAVKSEGEPGNSYWRETVLRFDLSSVTEEIGTVRLEMFCHGRAPDENGLRRDSLLYGCYIMDDDWDEMTVTWDNAPIPDFSFDLHVTPLKTDKTMINEMDTTFWNWGRTKDGELRTDKVEAERKGDGKISIDVYGITQKLNFMEADTWMGFTSKDSVTAEDRAARLLIWKKGNDPNTPVESNKKTAMQYRLHTNYPNPFNPSTQIGYTLAKAAPTEIRIINAAGQVIYTFGECPGSAGSHQVTWNGMTSMGQKATSGLYFYQIQSGEFKATKKMLLVQ